VRKGPVRHSSPASLLGKLPEVQKSHLSRLWYRGKEKTAVNYLLLQGKRRSKKKPWLVRRNPGKRKLGGSSLREVIEMGSPRRCETVELRGKGGGSKRRCKITVRKIFL